MAEFDKVVVIDAGNDPEVAQITCCTCNFLAFL
jgi:hypothetical protein